MNLQEAVSQWEADRPRFAELGVILPDVRAYVADECRRDYTIAMDAQPHLVTEPNAGIPAFLTTMVDPQVFRILFTPTKAAEILGEVRKGTWVDDVMMFPVVEHVGEVSSYGDFNNNGHAGVNQAWPQRQSYLFQTVEQYGEREIERAGLGRINWVSEMDTAAATVMNRFLNLSYFYGIAGLQNYGLLNEPSLSAAITPAVKAYGHPQWIYGGTPQATANEIYADIQALFGQLVAQTGGLVDMETKMTLVVSPGVQVALATANAFGITVKDLLKDNFPNLDIETAVQYGAVSGTNPQGYAGGNLAMLVADEIDGQDTGYAAFNEKMRQHAVVRDMSSFKKKLTGGTWGAVIRMSMAIATMVGI